MPVLGESIGGRYRLEAVIGRGGMSTVYRAFDTVLERPVAIKLLHPGVAADGDQLERFRREARLVARLSHPHVVTVIDAGEQPAGSDGDGPDPSPACPYIVLEYVEGETLKELIRRDGPLEIPQAVAYALELARGLGAAHAQHLVHRDVKPQNVLITEEGAAKITDFGIARPLTEAALTMPGRVLATTDYIAPEQALGEPVSGRSDLYSLGIVLFEMLTGDVPFHGDSAVAVAMKHVREQVPDVQRLRPGVSAATAAVVERATAKDPVQRYPDAESMAADLEQALALETSRSGQATGDVTSVLRTLPGESRERVPWRVRRPGWAATLLGAATVAVVAAALLAALALTHRGAGTGAAPPPADTGLHEVSLAQDAAHGYNPFGTGPENRDRLGNVVDDDPNTTWSTEQYYSGTLQKSGGVGLGLYLDAAPRLSARAVEVQTPTPGFPMEVYVANHVDLDYPYGSSAPLSARGWHGPVGSTAHLHSGERIPIRLGGSSYRYYLLWLTALPPGQQSASISEVSLFR
ncbi:MAG TPA: protein kinase [Solirubrobacteraceae bacterium]|nr:protein kinase [Solirubrobacteraceae bacterium]